MQYAIDRILLYVESNHTTAHHILQNGIALHHGDRNESAGFQQRWSPTRTYATVSKCRLRVKPVMTNLITTTLTVFLSCCRVELRLTPIIRRG
jgi:hypothetical protein